MNQIDVDNAARAGSFGDMGSNQSDLRDRNERLVLTIIRRAGPLPKAEIARRTGLSAQTVSVIIRDLEARGLLQKGEKLRGKVGQPSVPMQLSPKGAYFLGLKVGRRSAELVLVDFVGKELGHIEQTYNFPTPAKALSFVQDAVENLCSTLSVSERERIAGLGIATPFFMWEWANVIGVSTTEMSAWKDFDMCAEVANMFEFPVYLGNDATSACGAELTFGSLETPPDFLYIYLGYFAGGGIVLNDAVYSGKLGNAGAIGPFPVIDRGGNISQLVDTASLMSLERSIALKSNDPSFTLDTNQLWHIDEPDLVEQWMDDAAPSLAQLIVGACSIIDFSTIVIDGNMSGEFCALVTQRVSAALDSLPTSGLHAAEILQGSLGRRARPIGAASLALSQNFMLESQRRDRAISS